MLSPRKIEANRKNAQRSTGPRTAAGKARSSMNARRHGLAAKADSTLPLPAEVRALAAEFAGPSPEPVRWHFATIAAIEEVKLRRVFEAHMLTSSITAPNGNTRRDIQTFSEALPMLLRLQRYEQRALSRRGRALRCL